MKTVVIGESSGASRDATRRLKPGAVRPPAEAQPGEQSGGRRRGRVVGGVIQAVAGAVAVTGQRVEEPAGPSPRLFRHAQPAEPCRERPAGGPVEIECQPDPNARWSDEALDEAEESMEERRPGGRR